MQKSSVHFFLKLGSIAINLLCDIPLMFNCFLCILVLASSQYYFWTSASPWTTHSKCTRETWKVTGLLTKD